MVTFFFASAAASAAYLTAGEIFPLEIRALAIAFFFAIGTGIGGVVGPWWFANLINEGRESLYLGFVVLSAAMTAAALIELIWGVAAERRPAGRCRATADFHQMIPWDLLRCVNSVYVMKYRPEANRMIICNAILPLTGAAGLSPVLAQRPCPPPFAQIKPPAEARPEQRARPEPQRGTRWDGLPPRLSLP